MTDERAYDYHGRVLIDRDEEQVLSIGIIGIQRNVWIGHTFRRLGEVSDGVVTVTLLEEPFENWTALATFAERTDGVELRGKSVFRPNLPST